MFESMREPHGCLSFQCIRGTDLGRNDRSQTTKFRVGFGQDDTKWASNSEIFSRYHW